MNKELEKRNFSCNFEVREAESDQGKEIHLQGYALTFNTISEDLGGFKETISQGALDNCELSDVVLDFNHDFNKILARNNKTSGPGSLNLTIDEKGLFFDAIPTETTYSKDLIENIRNGILNKCSFIFSLDWNDSEAQKWDWDDGKRGYDFRTINKIKEISDVSIVVFPAYEQTETTIYKRLKDENKIEHEKAKEIEKQKIANEIELI